MGFCQLQQRTEIFIMYIPVVCAEVVSWTECRKQIVCLGEATGGAFYL